MNRSSLFACLIVLVPVLARGQAQEIRGTVDAVTVYRGQALVTRLLTIPGPVGLKEIVVTDLPEQVQPGSIYAESADGVEVRSVSYRVRPVEKDVRAEVQAVDEQIQAVQDKIDANQRKRKLAEEQKEYLGKLEQFTAATSSVELTRGVLNSDTLQKMTQYQFEQRTRIADDELRLGVELRGLNGQLQTLQRQRSQIATSSSKMAREAVVFVNLAGNGGNVRVRYLVNQATWLPSYNIRSAAARDRVTVEYLASIQQMSGEDWGNVQMMLSTATPSLLAKAPILNELAITLSRPGQAGAMDVLSQIEQVGTEQARQELQTQRQTLGNLRGAAVGQQLANSRGNYLNVNGTQINVDFIGDNNDLDLFLNKVAGDVQLVDLVARERIVRVKNGKGADPLDEGLAVTYRLPSRTSLPSRSDRQLIQIASIPLPAQYYKVASPLLTGNVFDEASVTNTSTTVFLAGDVATYVNNEFVGRGVMPSVAIGQKFNVGLGIDSSLRAHRELLEKTESMQGGNRVVDFTYRLSVENFGSQPAQVKLLDRLPTAKEAEVRVSLLTTGKDLSTDAAYEQTDRKKGILRLDAEVPAQAVDTGAMNLEYQFKMEYDRQLAIYAPELTTASAPAVMGGQGGGLGGGGGRGGRGNAGGLGIGGSLGNRGRGN